MRYRPLVAHCPLSKQRECMFGVGRGGSFWRRWRSAGDSSERTFASCRGGEFQLAVCGDERWLHIALRHDESETGARRALRPGKDGDAFAAERMEHPANEPCRTEQLLADDGDERNIRFQSKGSDDSARQIRSEFFAQRM